MYKALAFIRRDLQTQFSYRLNFITNIIRILVSISMFYFISRSIGTAITPYLQEYGGNYFKFVLVTLVFTPFMYLGLNSLPSIVSNYQSNGTLEILFLSPTPIFLVFLYSTLWYYLSSFLEALVYIILSIFVFEISILLPSFLIFALILLLGTLAHFGIGLFNASFTLVTKKGSPLSYFLPLLISLLGGAYFPVEVLPDWLRVVSRLLPTTYALQALRRALLQNAAPRELMTDISVLVGFSAILMPVGWIALHYAIRQAKIDGSLAQY